MNDAEIVITGANGQLGKALQTVYPKAAALDSAELDITDQVTVQGYDWSKTRVIINAAAYTNVDGAETLEGGKLAWQVNDKAVGYLAGAANLHNILLVQISTAYVFDGKKKIYTENDQPNPLGIYAKTKLAGERQAAKTPAHLIIRTDSVVGDGKNFVRTMLGLAEKGISPTVVADQYIRPSFTNELARGIKFLIDNNAEYGVYNLTNEGDVVSWADFTRAIFKEAHINSTVTDTTFKEYSAGKEGIAPRPLNSVLDLAKIESLGFTPRDWHEDLKEYVKKEKSR